MARRPWTVIPHQPLRKHEDNLWSVEGPVPGVPIGRRMTIVKRQDGTLAFFNAVPVDDATLDEIRRLGEPRYLVVPHYGHAVDADAFKRRLNLTAYGPPEHPEKLARRVDLD